MTGARGWLGGRDAGESVLDWIWGVWDAAGVALTSVREKT